MAVSLLDRLGFHRQLKCIYVLKISVTLRQRPKQQVGLLSMTAQRAACET